MVNTLSNGNESRNQWYSSFHLNTDLSVLWRMQHTLSLKLSSKAKQRLAWMDYYRFHPCAALVCRHFGISVRTFWFWRARYNPWDLVTLEDESKKPKHCPRKTEPFVEMKIIALKKEHPGWGRKKIQFVLERNEQIRISERTISRVVNCYRNRLPKICVREKKRLVKPRVKRKDVLVPGDLLQMDTKFVRFGSHMFYQYTIIDVVSRLRFAEIFRTHDMHTTNQFLSKILPMFPCKVKRIQTDNGSEFASLVSAELKQREIQHVFSHVRRPIENCFVERSHRMDDDEFYNIPSLHGSTYQEFVQNFQRHNETYNTLRPHSSLNYQTPQSVLNLYLQSLAPVCKMS